MIEIRPAKARLDRVALEKDDAFHFSRSILQRRSGARHFQKC
jgi:hypothetical protein